ncbi:hypothetical protein GCM10011321_20030 [Youhaiella tibetensis]|uniref:Glycoside hydrolase family 2 n=1 Tax=Paradevosia tibetensis TaxID=1447062 RepID=A0A5B9DL28_9HYPH|nr:sugar-binding domain-containing protein [Youhaiella tibetensis]QEE19930.1 glycoside hydrolase family 2 [Youhaiella tibetensis]GGF28600.1 hypothetical protein GCM10011321_20030 [Youhaiella tibetensis]
MTVRATVTEAGARAALSLDGAWRFRMEGEENWRSTNVPNPWQAEFADLRHSFGRAVYARGFTIPADWQGREVAIRFGAVNYVCEVYLNGKLLGSHEGGYLPFEFVLPADALEADNALEVRVALPSGDTAEYPDYPFGEIPHGKQSWYGPLGGIWQSVTLEARDPRHLVHAALDAELATGAVRATLEFSAAAKGALVEVTVTDPDGAEVVSASGEAGADISFVVPNVAPWSPEAPNLYSAQVDLKAADGALLDRTRHTFGFRTIETRDGKFFLNGQPLYLRGALDQDYYPEGICTPPSLDFLEDQARKAKELGLNLLRCHIKVPDPRYHEVADRLGLLVWTEIPNLQHFSERGGERLRETMSGILRRDGNHPSIIAWTIINEDWGTRLVESAEHRQWLKDTYDWLKAEDPSRLVVDNSACIPNFHVKTDINDYHYYRSIPERRAEWEKLTEEFAAGADWTYSPHGDAERRGDEPLVVSEFGVWGLPNPTEIRDASGNEPWWTETGGNWGDGGAYPHGIENRFATYHLGKVFGSLDGFIEAVQWYQFDNLKYEIESMRAHAPIVGYVITELTDVHWEANGLLDMNRNPRVFHERFAEINADLVIVPQLAHHAAYAGSEVAISLKIATGGSSVPAGASLSWSLDGGASGEIAVPPTGGLAVADLGVLKVQLPAGSENRMARVTFSLHAGGKELAGNEIAISVYAQRSTAGLPRVATSDAGLAARATVLGYQVVDAASADVVLARSLAAADILAMQQGARYVVLADGKAPTHRNLRSDVGTREPPFMPIVDETPGMPMGSEAQLPNINLVERQGTIWRGDWIANFSWIKRQGAFADLPGGPLLDASYDRVVPYHVLTGFRSWEYEGLVHAALAVGYLNKPAALIAQRSLDRGGLVATTFRLTEDAPGADPVATALFDAVIKTAVGIGAKQKR